MHHDADQNCSALQQQWCDWPSFQLCKSPNSYKTANRILGITGNLFYITTLIDMLLIPRYYSY